MSISNKYFVIGNTTYTLTPLALDGEDQSFTMSYSLNIGNWAFFHDYIPDMYFYTRNQLFALKNPDSTDPSLANITTPTIYKVNSGGYGCYITNQTTAGCNPKSFFIDLVFATGADTLLNTINWISQIIDSQGTEIEFKTITHISVWNSEQHSGRIRLSDFFETNGLNFYASLRKTKGNWSFNDFRDVLLERGVAFLEDIFSNFNLRTDVLLAESWYDRQRMQDIYYVIRFEYDNLDQNQLVLHDQETNKVISNR